MTASFDLSGRRALVAGGTGTLGLGIARALADAGADVCLVGRTANAESARRAIPTAPQHTVHAVRCDLSDRAELRRGFAAALAALGSIDVLVNAQGVSISGDSVTFDEASWDQTFAVNINSVMSLCQLAGARMLDAGYGKIINIASLFSFVGSIRVAAYSASKGAVAQLTKSLAIGWAAGGVNVNAIAPGFFRSEMNRELWEDESASDTILSRIPAGRWGEASDLAGAAVFLASPASDYVSGVVLPVDGGYLSR